LGQTWRRARESVSHTSRERAILGAASTETGRGCGGIDLCHAFVGSYFFMDFHKGYELEVMGRSSDLPQLLSPQMTLEEMHLQLAVSRFPQDRHVDPKNKRSVVLRPPALQSSTTQPDPCPPVPSWIRGYLRHCERCKNTGRRYSVSCEGWKAKRL